MRILQPHVQDRPPCVGYSPCNVPPFTRPKTLYASCVSLANAKTKIDVAVAAMGSDDWAAAETALMQAEAELSVVADGRHGGTEMRYRDQIDALLGRVRSNANATAGISTSKITYQRPTDA